MKPKKKYKNYIPILDQPIEELKKSTGQSVDFDAAMTQILKDSGKQKGQK